MPQADARNNRVAPATAADWAGIEFEPCDSQKFPVRTEKDFSEMMEHCSRIGYAAHVVAYFPKDAVITLLNKMEGQEAPTMMDDFKEVRAILSELCRTIKAVEYRLIIAGACLEVADAQG